MDFSQYFPVWDKLTADEQRVLSQSAVRRSVKKGTVLHRGLADCLGLLVVGSGQLRVYSVSDDGREVTLYRLFERDICLLSASCMIESLQFDVIIEAEKDTGFWVVPPAVYKGLMERSAVIANYTSQIMATHFSESIICTTRYKIAALLILLVAPLKILPSVPPCSPRVSRMDLYFSSSSAPLRSLMSAQPQPSGMPVWRL